MDASYCADHSKILARGTADGHSLELIQQPDGITVILHDGNPLQGIDWRAAGFDGCMRTYLGMLRHRPQADA